MVAKEDEGKVSGAAPPELVSLLLFVDSEIRERKVIEGMREKLQLSYDDRAKMIALFDAAIEAIIYRRNKYIAGKDGGADEDGNE